MPKDISAEKTAKKYFAFIFLTVDGSMYKFNSNHYY